MIFKEKPKGFNKNIDVVGCYIEHDGKFVLLHRQPEKANGNTHGLPAGKIDPGEDMHTAMLREIGEETGLAISRDELRFGESLYVRNEGYDLIFHTFSVHLAEKPEIVISLHEHQGYCWVSPAEALTMNLIHDLHECITLFYKLS